MRLAGADEVLGSMNEEVTGMFLLGTLANHACTPSASRVYLGDVMFMRAARELEAGEEVTISYSPFPLSLPERQTFLKGYGFVCRCLRCKLEECASPQELLAPVAGITVADAAAQAAKRAESQVCSVASVEVLAEARACSFNIRGLFLVQHFNALLRRVGELTSPGEPEALSAAILFEEAIAAVLPYSPVHSWCCSTLMIATGVAAAKRCGDAMAGAMAAAAASRACEVHAACYGGGEELWRRRLKGGPAAQHAKFFNLPCPIRVSLPTPWCMLRPSDDGTVEVDLSFSQAATAPHVDFHTRELRVTVVDATSATSVTRVQLDPGWIDVEASSGRWSKHRRRLLLRLPLRSKPTAA